MKTGLLKKIVSCTIIAFLLPLLNDAFAAERTDTINRVPYISTYHTPFKANSSEPVIINYYVTDYDQKEYRKGDTVQSFTIDYWVNGEKKSVNHVLAGDRSIDLGVLPKGKILFALQATDQQGIKSHRLFHAFLVDDPANNLPADKILTPDLKKFNISNTNTDPVETTAGLTAMLKWASTQGYKTVVLPSGIYRIDENAPVLMASKLTLDMNGSTFLLNPNTKDQCLMLDFVNCSDSHVINGTFEGDLKEHDFARAPNDSAEVNGISLSQGSETCSVENVTLRNITGNGIVTRHGLPVSQPQRVKGFSPGDSDALGQKILSPARVTTDDFIDIADMVKTTGFIQLGCYLVSQGNPIDNWVYRAHFYDAAKKPIESIEGYLYRRLYPPADAAFVKFTLFSKSNPEALAVFAFQSPYNCSLINVTLQNIRSAGIALNGFEHLLVEGCRFTNCGHDLAQSAFYAKDGLDIMQDLTVRNTLFPNNPHTDFMAAAGHNFVVEGNIAKLDLSDRAHSFVLRSNQAITSLRLTSGPKAKTGYCRVQNNRFREDFTISNATQGEDDWKLVVKESLIQGRGDGAGAILFNCRISGATLANCEISRGTLGSGTFSNGYVHDMVGHNTGGNYWKCNLERISGTIQATLDVNNSIITDWDCTVIGKGTTVKIKDSKLNNVLLTYGHWFQGAQSTIDGCTINNWDYMLRIPYYSLKEPITFSNNTFTTLGNKGMIFFYHDVVGKSAGPAVDQEPLTIKNNTLNLGDSDYVVMGPSRGTKQKLNFVFEKNIVNPKQVRLYDPGAKISENITIVER